MSVGQGFWSPHAKNPTVIQRTIQTLGVVNNIEWLAIRPTQIKNSQLKTTKHQNLSNSEIASLKNQIADYEHFNLEVLLIEVKQNSTKSQSISDFQAQVLYSLVDANDQSDHSEISTSNKQTKRIKKIEFDHLLFTHFATFLTKKLDDL